MRKNFTIAAALLISAGYYAQSNPRVLQKGNQGMYAQHVKFDKSQPDFRGTAVLFDDSNSSLTDGEGKVLRSDNDKLGFQSHKIQQSINGIPVQYGIMNVVTKNGKIVSENGEWVKNVPASASKKASISESVALDRALAYVGAVTYKWQDANEEAFLKEEQKDASATFKPKGEMVYYSDPGEKSNKLQLAYKFDIYASEPVSRQLVFVNASSGEILGTEALIHETNAIGTAVTGYSGNQTITTDQVSTTSYRLRESGRNGGTAVETYNLKQGTQYNRASDFTDTDNNWNNVNTAKDQYATDAHWGAEKTVDYYYTKFGRKSIDNNNFGIKSYVHYSKNYFNAFWDGTRMTYGDGSSVNGNMPLTALDVCGHEITHGLTSKSANLAYQKESGAMNEGFSDIFGNTIELWARPNKASWKLGEDFNYVIRDMSNPNAYKQPDTYQGTYWVSTTCTPSSTNDYCGVHTNSGVLNFWYYLLTVGGSGTNDKGFAYNVTGIGIDKAGAIAYRTLTTYLTSSSTFADARAYSLQAAADLYGAGGAEVTQTTNAWNAVGVGGGTSPAGLVATAGTTTYTVATVSNGNYVVAFASDTEDVKTIDFISATGVKMASKTVNSVQGNNTVEMQLPATALSGVYFVMVNGKKEGAVIKK